MLPALVCCLKKRPKSGVSGWISEEERGSHLMGIAPGTSSSLFGMFSLSFAPLSLLFLTLKKSGCLQAWLWRINAEGRWQDARTRCGARRSGPAETCERRSAVTGAGAAAAMAGL